MKIKKCVSLFLVFVVSLSMTPLFSLTAEATKYDVSIPFEDYVIAHLENYESEIDILDYAIKNNWDENNTKGLFLDILDDNPQLFFVKKENGLSWSYTTTKAGTKLSKFNITKINYSMNKSEYIAAKKAFDKAAKKALEVVNDSMAGWEKALALHDYLVLNMSYNQKEFEYMVKNKKSSNPNAYTAYGAFIEKTAVCEGYSAAYKYLLNKLGIECEVIKSNTMNHAWNYVNLDGKWYHVDITWSDPLLSGQYDLLGGATHNHFLVSDSKIKNLDHKDWDTKGLPAAKSTKYNNYFWKNAETGIFNVDGLWYWIEIDKTSPAYNKNYEKLDKSNPAEFNNNFYKMYSLIKKYNPETGKTSTVYKFYSTWFTWGTENSSTKSWVGTTYARLASYKGNLYFNTAKEIFCFDLSTNKASAIFSPSNLNGYIYGFVMDGKKATYTVKQKTAQADNFKSKSISA